MWGLAEATSFVDANQFRTCWELIDRIDFARSLTANHCVSVILSEACLASGGARAVSRYHLELFCDPQHDFASVLAQLLEFC